jgi:hypothetical protein
VLTPGNSDLSRAAYSRPCLAVAFALIISVALLKLIKASAGWNDPSWLRDMRETEIPIIG